MVLNVAAFLMHWTCCSQVYIKLCDDLFSMALNTDPGSFFCSQKQRQEQCKVKNKSHLKTSVIHSAKYTFNLIANLIMLMQRCGLYFRTKILVFPAGRCGWGRRCLGSACRWRWSGTFWPHSCHTCSHISASAAASWTVPPSSSRRPTRSPTSRTLWR